MRVVFMGTPDYATKILEELLACNGIIIPLLVTQPDKPIGRKQILKPPHIKEYILNKKVKIEVYQPKTLKNTDAYEHINSFQPDFIVVAAYGQILPSKILQIAPCINLHASLLPKYRGASPIQTSILNGDKFTGVTAMLMEEGLDTGDILNYSYIQLDENIKVEELFEKLSIVAGKLILKTLKNFNNIKPIKQNNADSSYAKKIIKKDGHISLKNSDASQIYKKFRAYTPWPGLFLESGLKLTKIEQIKGIGKPATIIATEKSAIIVACKNGALRIKMVQPSSKKEMGVLDYIRGKRLKIGNSLV